ncbi:uncharacterized protein BDFB_003835 [Asbolus verrucosus]|uniref:Uncharacterized protein n=1 Tax=Asbolus verrucosus TaxID=1661398 RepID=A0A482VIU1_ASBVE|nr:uncharacterized protein BDFB_003835 [Asbolus verrucosus]
MEVTKSASKKTDKKKSRKIAVIVDFLFCGLVTLLWVTAFSFFVRFSLNSQQEKVNAHEYFYFSYFIIVVIVSVTGIYFESLILKGFEKFSPKIAVVVKKGQCKNGPYVLKLRVADVPDKEFLETELEESNLTYDDVLNVCCKELKLEKDNIVRLRKIPDTKIRNDDDIKRFRRLEYLEVITKE